MDIVIIRAIVMLTFNSIRDLLKDTKIPNPLGVLTLSIL